jgi:hypothetical protein
LDIHSKAKPVFWVEQAVQAESMPRPAVPYVCLKGSRQTHRTRVQEQVGNRRYDRMIK